MRYRDLPQCAVFLHHVDDAIIRQPWHNQTRERGEGFLILERRRQNVARLRKKRGTFARRLRFGTRRSSRMSRALFSFLPLICAVFDRDRENETSREESAINGRRCNSTAPGCTPGVGSRYS